MAIKTALMSWALVLACALPAFSSDLIIQPSVLYPYRSTIELSDEFMNGVAAAGSVGNTGWGITGTVSALTSEANRIGLYRFSTGAVSGTFTRLNMTVAGSINPANPTILTWDVRLNTNDANSTMRVGASDGLSAAPGNGFYLEKLDADTNWFCVARSGGIQTRVDSGVAVSTNFFSARYVRNSSGVQFSIDNVNVCGLITTNLPTSFIVTVVHLVNSAAAAKTFDVDYFSLSIFGLTR